MTAPALASGGRRAAAPGSSRRAFCLLAAGAFLGLAARGATEAEPEALAEWTARFSRDVGRKLDVPPADQLAYLERLQQVLAAAGLLDPAPQCFLLVDRSPQVQMAAIIVRTRAGGWHWLGATAVSTGKPGQFEHFYTPLGMFAHSLDNPDFRALGTFNKNHIQGYGRRGLRVFDFGWQVAERGWGKGGSSPMRLQMHATDPQRLEPRLGRVASEGCVRIPATLNVFLDEHGVLDADYEAAAALGAKLWVLKPDRQPLPWPGRYLVVVDSQVQQRPAWSSEGAA